VFVASNVILVGHKGAFSFLVELLTELAKLRRIEREAGHAVFRSLKLGLQLHPVYHSSSRSSRSKAFPANPVSKTRYRKENKRHKKVSTR